MVDSTHPHTVVVTARGDVDMATSPLLQSHLDEWIRCSGPDLVVDLTGVRHFGSAGVTVLVRAAASAKTAGVEFLVVAGGRVVLRPLRIIGVHDAFGVYPTISQTLERACGDSPTATTTPRTPLRLTTPSLSTATGR
ncbi:STAS domain-containing protein [Umezawaea sp. Da 62-37]|uniref:STAS domain-containing protein n=1 Tax=Umezawaea sp. Da 62-37 TaxID=3075927 RepID=UPI0028F71C8A|nr:STAS domain-containing protein [Umezawaea sp. Da 62-37]WNV84827.1 STAS domain-containing protein [Umezawaea sp. Da 62-37]